MNRFVPLLETPLVVLGRFDHPAGQPHRDPEQEAAPGYSLNFVEQGEFELRVGRERWQVAAGRVFFTRPQLVYRIGHADDQPRDVCFTLDYQRAFVEDVRTTFPRLVFPPTPVLPPTNRLAYLRWRLRRVAASRDALAAETLAGELLGAASEAKAGASDGLFKEHLFGWYRDRVEATRERLETAYAVPHSLDSLSRTVGMSPFHFSRVFRRLVGAPPHRYLLRVRLVRAAERLLEGESVTQTCYATGFNNLSHFIRLFRRAFGVSPSQYARQPRPWSSPRLN